MSNRLPIVGQAPQEYAPDWFGRLERATRNELSRLTAFAAIVTWDPANIGAGASTTKTVSVPGVKVAAMNHVRVFAPYTLSGLSLSGYVDADDSVTLVLANNTAGAVNLASAVFGVAVENFVLTV